MMSINDSATMFIGVVWLFSFSTLANDTNMAAADNNANITEVTCQDYKLEANPVTDLAGYVNKQHFIELGKAKFSVLFWDIYESSLLTSDGHRPFNTVCQQSLFEISYLRNISKRELIDNTISQWQHLSLNEKEYADFLPLLENIWQDINAGDQLSMLTQQDKTIFYLNRKNIGEIESYTFAQLFLGIWLDESTSEPRLRLKLLGEST